MNKRRIAILGLTCAIAFLMWESFLVFHVNDWAALGVKQLHGPVKITVVNGTSQAIPWIEVGIGGWLCHDHHLEPAASMRCEPSVRGASAVLVALPEDGPNN